MKKSVKIAIGAFAGLIVISGVAQQFIKQSTPPEPLSNATYNSVVSDMPEKNTPSPTPALESNSTDSLKNNETANENIINPSEMNGRGRSDSSREEPQYVGITGYVVIGSEQENALKKADGFMETPWTISLSNGELLEHKTEVVVKSQELKHEGWGSYSGLLTAERIDTKEEIVINVNNFITKPYWTYEDLSEAAKIGYYIAEYHQAGTNYPVTRDNEIVDLEEGLRVLIVGPTGLYGGNGPDSNVNSIEGIVFKEWKMGYGGISIFFDPQDLTIIY